MFRVMRTREAKGLTRLRVFGSVQPPSRNHNFDSHPRTCHEPCCSCVEVACNQCAGSEGVFFTGLLIGPSTSQRPFLHYCRDPNCGMQVILTDFRPNVGIICILGSLGLSLDYGPRKRSGTAQGSMTASGGPWGLDLLLLQPKGPF